MPRNSDIVPMVTTIEGIRNRVMMAPLKAPAAVPATTLAASSPAVPTPSVASQRRGSSTGR